MDANKTWVETLLWKYLWKRRKRSIHDSKSCICVAQMLWAKVHIKSKTVNPDCLTSENATGHACNNRSGHLEGSLPKHCSNNTDTENHLLKTDSFLEIYIYICMYICMYIYTYTFICIHAYIHYITLNYNTLHYNTLHYFSVQYTTLHYITLHHITLH